MEAEQRLLEEEIWDPHEKPGTADDTYVAKGK